MTAVAPTAKDFKSDQEIRWCPGCGDYAILKQMQKVMADLKAERHNTVFVSGIGCSSRFPYYMNTYGFHTIHGRGPAVATGLKVARPELDVWLITGDGDGLSIGAGHLVHTMRRNVDINILLFNNRIYGLTKGQYSPTSEVGKKTKSTPMGSLDTPINPLQVALASEAAFVGRCIDVDGKHQQEMLKRAAAFRGTAFLEIYQDCNVYNHMAWEYATDRKIKAENIVVIEHGQPLIFGAERNKGIHLDGLKPRIVELGNGVGVDDLLVHDETDATLAYLLTQLRYPDFPEPVGVFHAVERPCYEKAVAEQIAAAREKKGEGDLKALIHGGDTWIVE